MSVSISVRVAACSFYLAASPSTDLLEISHHLLSRQRVEDELTLLSGANQARQLEGPQVLGDGRDRLDEDVREVAHTALFHRQDVEDRQPCGVTNRLMAVSLCLQLIGPRQAFLERVDPVRVEAYDLTDGCPTLRHTEHHSVVSKNYEILCGGDLNVK